MKTVLDSLNAGLTAAMASDPTVLVLGEDLLDPYGGAFKVTRGLSTAYPDRVRTTPISEPGFVGVATGMALKGFKPVAEIMFGDFTTLIADQVINGLSKYGWMYGGQLDLPVVIRTPMGGGRGYGPTHSQTLEKHFLGIPGLKLLAPTAFTDPGALLQAAIADPGPVIFIENKLQYQRRLDEPDLAGLTCSVGSQSDYASTVLVSVTGAPEPAVTMAAYGFMADQAARALLRLAYEFEIFAELVVVEQLDPLGPGGQIPPALVASLTKTGRLITVEEGVLTHGWGAEVIARCAEALDHKLAVRRVAAADTPIPAAPALERETLPDVSSVVEATRKLVGESNV